MHDIVTSYLFLLITGVCSIIGLGLALFATNKVLKIDNSMKINNQIISADNNSKAGGRDVG